MEAKKNPSKDLSLQRNKFFLIGLTVSISLAITAFEWQTVKVKTVPPQPDPIESQIDFIILSTNIDPPAAPQQIQKIEIKKLIQIDPTSITTATDKIQEEDKPMFTAEPEPNPSIGTSIPDPEPEDPTIHFTVVEKDPEPINGYKSFYQQLAKNLKYPIQARRIGTEGKVIVEFIVNKNGEPSDLKVIRGIGSGCDEEAMRVLSLTRWEPGKQRGRPVRVKMAMQISFQLAN
jgi:periplasmic protein TonB